MSKKLENIEFETQKQTTIEEVSLRSNEVQEILHKMPIWIIRWGNMLIFIMLLLLLFVSWMIKYPDLITADVMVTTDVPPESIVAKTTGKIAVFFVKDGEKVVENQDLAIIDNNANYNDVKSLKNAIQTSVFTKDSIYFPLDNLPLLQIGSLNSFFADFQDNYLDYTFDKENDPLQIENASQKFSKQEIAKRIKQLNRQKYIASSKLRLKYKDYNRYKKLFSKGIISEMKLDAKQSEVLQQRSVVNSIKSKISVLKEGLNLSETKSGIIDLKKSQRNTQLAQKVYQSIEKLKSEIDNWERKFVLKAATSGKVSYIKPWFLNQNISEGTVVFVVIPSNFSHYVARLTVPSKNTGKLKIGQQVQIKLTNFPYEEFGMLIGKVDKISEVPDAKGNYFVDVNLPKKLMTSFNKPIDFKQNMRGNAEIITEDLRVIERIFYKFRKLFTH